MFLDRSYLSSASPDFGVEGVIDRFGQIEPIILVTTDGYFNGKEINITDKINKVVKLLPSINNIILIPLLNSSHQYFSEKVILYQDLLIDYKSNNLNFERLNLNHPLYMYSSGTTGKPKCIVHSGGVLLKHLVKLGLHSNAGDNKNIFYFTTCGWMMWNWLVSSLMLNSNVCIGKVIHFIQIQIFYGNMLKKKTLIFLGHLQNILMLVKV